MAARKKSRDIEIDTDPALQKRIWKWQRLAWTAMGAIILAALLGLFGDSPLSRATASDPAGRIRVEYDRAGRRGAEQILTLELNPDDSGRAQLRINREYVEAAGIERISPSPTRESAESEETTYTFDADSAGENVRVSFKLVPTGLGRLQARVRWGTGPALSFSQFIYP